MANYEAGLERVSASILFKIAVTLEVTLASLFGVVRLQTCMCATDRNRGHRL